MGKGSGRRQEDSEAVRRRWPLGEVGIFAKRKVHHEGSKATKKTTKREERDV